MAIRSVEDNDFTQLAALYKEFFPTHNVFHKNEDIVVAYLRKEMLEREDFLVYEDEGKILGSLILVSLGTSETGTHTRWKFRHTAFIDEEVGQKLLEEAEKRIKAASKTAKIELTIAETEQGMDFYIDNGYVVEGELKDHYRVCETCFILGKSFK